MSRVRFTTARDLFDTFPEVPDLIGEPPSDEPSLAFLKRLAAAKPAKAITFCAYLLPRREAVAWACRSARILMPIPDGRDGGLRAAEAWVEQPDDEHRDTALRIAAAGSSDDPLNWLAQAAGWSGGILFAHPEKPVPVSPAMTARAARVAVTLASLKGDLRQRQALVQQCVAYGAVLAETGL